MNDKKCIYCKNIAYNVCLKCDLNICDSCQKDHESKDLSNELRLDKKLVVPITDKQYFCKNHLLIFSKFCPICKINLCDECLIEHIHINCHKLLEEEKDLKNFEVKKYNGLNETFIELTKISKYFHLIYVDGFKNKKMTYNIIFNLHLIREINSYINKNINKTPKKGIKKIQNKIPIPENEFYTCKSYGDLSFNLNYNKLLSQAQLGNIDYYHKFLKIKELYINRDNLKEDPLSFLGQGYLISLKLSINETKDSIYKINSIIESNDFKHFSFNLLKEVEKLKLKINILELNIDKLKQCLIDINYRNDFKLRIKTGNLITDQIIDKNFNNLEPIKLNEYILGLSIENLDEKISKASKIKLVSKRDEYLNILKEKYNKGLNLLNEITSNKLDLIKNNNYDISSIKKQNINMQFKNNNNEDREIHKAVILNLFLYVRKELNQLMNDTIQNATEKVNSLIKEEMDKLENINKNHENINKNNVSDDKVENHINGNNINPKIINQKNKKIEKSCKNNLKYINEIKNIIQLPIKRFEGNNKYLDLFTSKINDKIIDSNIKEFNKILNEINISYNVDLNILIDEAFNLFFEGNKAEILSEEKKYNFKKTKEEELLKLYEYHDDNLTYFLHKTMDSLNENLEFLETMKYNTLILINNCAGYFNINDILKDFRISLPLTPLNIINKLTSLKIIFDEKILEKEFFILQIYHYFILKEGVTHLKEIKKKIKNLRIHELLKSYQIKNNLINKIKENMPLIVRRDLLSEVWKDISNSIKIIEGNDELNNKILNYVKNNDKIKFKKDLVSLIKPEIKDINIGLNDPQNIFLKPFMKQNCLDFPDI